MSEVFRYPNYKDEGLSDKPFTRRRMTKIILDPLSVLWLIIAFILMLWIATFMDYDYIFAFKGIFVWSMGMGAFFLAQILIGFKWDKNFSGVEAEHFLMLTTISITLIFMINAVTTVGSSLLSTVPVSTSLFLMLVGIQEEIFIRGLLQSLFYNLSNNTALSVVGCNVIFSMMHVAVLGGEDFISMFIIGAGGIGLSVVYLLGNRRLSIVQTGHAFYNLIIFILWMYRI